MYLRAVIVCQSIQNFQVSSATSDLRRRYCQQLLSLTFPRCRFVYAHTFLTFLRHSVHICFVSTSELWNLLQLRAVR